MVTYADKPWLKYYPNTIPHSLQPYPNVPVHHYLQEAARKYPNNVALVTSAHLPVVGRIAQEITYSQLDQSSDALAAYLVDQGLQKGDRVGLIMPNIAAFVIAYYGVLKAGGVVAATNPTYPADKMVGLFEDSGAKFAIVMSLFYNTLNEFRDKVGLKHAIVTSVKDWLPRAAGLLFGIAKEKKEGHYVENLKPGDVWLPSVLSRYTGKKASVTVTPEDNAIFQYTGGTTGIPKAAVAQHKHIVANLEQSRAFLLGGDANAKGENEIFLGAIPMFHVYGLITVVGFAVSLGARILLVVNARNIPDLLDIATKFKPTIFMGVPALYNAINQHAGIKSGEYSVKSIRLCMSGSAPLPPITKREFEAISGGKVLEGFGMSETPTSTHCNPLFAENRTGSIGIPMPDIEVRIVNLEDEVTDVPVGEVGELVISGPNIMRGYHNMPDETARALREKDGKTWLYTGDIAKMDEDGYCYIVDRKKDMAIVGGYNVYPTTVEKVLREHAAISDVAVAAIPHPEKLGQEALKAWIVLFEGASVTEKELVDFCTSRLARYEIPTRFAFIKELPKTTVGKTLRRELVAMEVVKGARSAEDTFSM
jgi:long-chain acyl-CoA synthetase